MNSVSKKARIGNNVTIGNYTTIEDDVEIGSNVSIGTNVIIANGARIADNVSIHHGAVISSNPQDLKFKGEKTELFIGEGTTVREYSTLNRGTSHSGKTIIGKNCFLMSYVHVAHDCKIGDNVIIANSTNMGGHVFIDDNAFVGGMVAIHQFSRIGKHAMIGADTKIVKDIPPYVLASGVPAKFEGINLVGLKRKGFSDDKIQNIKDSYNMIYKAGLNVSDALKELTINNGSAEAKEIIQFIKASERGIFK